MKWLLLKLIRFYQRAISPGLPAACRYQPSCSHYAYEAIERYGAMRGSWMAVGRLARCVPWRSGGYDPVPERKKDPQSAMCDLHEHGAPRQGVVD
jgi:putative membrane protein insertion efficiency factor